MKVIIIYGSANDKEFMEPARSYLDEKGTGYDEHVISAHRNLPELIEGFFYHVGHLSPNGNVRE